MKYLMCAILTMLIAGCGVSPKARVLRVEIYTDHAKITDISVQAPRDSTGVKASVVPIKAEASVIEAKCGCEEASNAPPPLSP
jgi:hypothetical protein